MSKTIHIHIHRAPAKDAWEESKHKRAANGQFGSGGGGAAAKPASKSAPATKPDAPKPGEVGHRELEQYGAYYKKGQQVRLPGGKIAEVVSHIGPSVETTAGNFHPTKISAAPKADNPQNVATQLAARKNQLKELQAEMKTGKYSPEDVAELKNKEASLKRMIANYESKSAAKSAPGAGAPRPVTANERKDPNQVRSDVIATINKRLDGPLTAQSKKELLEKKARLIAAQKADLTSGAKPAAQSMTVREAPAKPKQRSNAKTESYSWGKLTSVSNPSITAVAHPEDRAAIHALGDGEVHNYQDEQKHKWAVSRHGEEIYFTEPGSKTASLTAKRSDFE